MIKKIKIVDNTVRTALRDTTIGVEYLVATIAKGTKCPDGVTAMEDTISFIDDEGDWVSLFVDDNTGYEVVEEDSSMINNNQVNWDEIPDDVEAVLTYGITESTFFKKIEDKLYSQCWRHSIYKKSGWDEYSEILDYFGDRFHLRPSPITQPNPEPPESTQVESSEVEATTTPEFDWSSVEDDVEAIILYNGVVVQHLKTDDYGQLLMDRFLGYGWENSTYKTLDERELHIKAYWDGTATLIRRPPATTTPQDIGLNEAYDTYKKVAAEVKDIDISSIQTETYTPKPPSILTILQEAQQSILKHHRVTGKVKFTVTCS